MTTGRINQVTISIRCSKLAQESKEDLLRLTSNVSDFPYEFTLVTETRSPFKNF